MFPDIVSGPLKEAYAQAEEDAGEELGEGDEAAEEGDEAAEEGDNNDGVAKKRKTPRMVIFNRVCTALFNKATPEQKHAVEEARQAGDDLRVKMEKAEEELTPDEQGRCVVAVVAFRDPCLRVLLSL